ncbi:U-box domain-containing protein 17 [Acorus gramineus]|uniref:RING-type E3 ubiquitin transferase n=1 Tax=Acorus gramineus TaxID=55184 RepID=A0AAV8ZZQ3_ACOGR|nr:U-box domain-containing protein 17 [Acorus gramineus]
MACAAVFSSLRRRKSPLLGAFYTPSDLSGPALVETLQTMSSGILANSHPPHHQISFQRRNTRSLLRKIEVFSLLFDSFKDSNDDDDLLPSSAVLCLKELYILIYRSKILLDYCSQSSRLWLLLQNPALSGHFHDLNQEFSTLLDVFPLDDIRKSLSDEVCEHIDLLRRQSRRLRLFVDANDEDLRGRIFSFIDQLDHGGRPCKSDLREVFVVSLGISDAKSCRAEIEFLEEQLYNQEDDVDPTVLNGVIALARYCRFLLFGFDEEVIDVKGGRFKRSTGRRMRGYNKTSDCHSDEEEEKEAIAVPKDFCCPISLDLMRDPVIVSTGQTYDRASIVRWMEEGHSTCPNSGQTLTHHRLVPNRTLRSLISQWCAAHDVPYEPPDDAPSEATLTASMSRAAVEANRATVELLVNQLEGGSETAKTAAARELRLLAKTGKENRVCIAEAGAIPLLRGMLSSRNPVIQENSVTAMLNLSIHDKNKVLIMEEKDCLRFIVGVLRHGWVTEARENAAATLFSLSAVHDYKKRIADEPGALEALADLLKDGSSRGKKDAVTAMFNLSTHAGSCARMVDSGAVSALVGALATDGVAEEAAGALALLVRQPLAAASVGKEEKAVHNLVGLMRRGSPRGKENAVAALLELCRSGGSAVTERVVRAPALGGLLQTLLFTGTKRARRKAASLARVCQRCEYTVLTAAMQWSGGDRSRVSSNFGADVSVVPMAISVPVL